MTVWSEGARETLGWTEPEMLGHSLAAFFTPEDRQAGVHPAEMLTFLRDGRCADEKWHERKDGCCFWANGEMTPLLDEAGEAQGFIKILRDRTEKPVAQAAYQAFARQSSPATWPGEFGTR